MSVVFAPYTSPVRAEWNKVCWSPELDLFCAVAGSTLDNVDTRIMTSPDGVTWTTHSTPAGLFYTDICWSPSLGLFCAVANNTGTNSILTSPDGVTWTQRDTGNSYVRLKSIAWSPSLSRFIAAGKNLGPDGLGTKFVLYTSTNGTAWTALGLSAATSNTVELDGILWAPGLNRFVAWGFDGAGWAIFLSSTGAGYFLWETRIESPIIYGDVLKTIAWSEELGLLVAAGLVNSTTSFVATSPNGSTWTTHTIPEPSGGKLSINALTWSAETQLFLGVGLSEQSSFPFGPLAENAVTSSDGITWDLIEAPSNLPLNGILWAQEPQIFVAVGSNRFDVGNNILSAEAPNLTDITSLICPIVVTGYTPVAELSSPIRIRAVEASVLISGNSPTIGIESTEIWVAGRGFATDASITMVDTPGAAVTGRGFVSTPEIYGGATAAGRGFTSVPFIAVDITNTIYVTGQGFWTTPAITLDASFDSRVAGRGFRTRPEILGGAVVTGVGFASAPSIQVETSTSINVIGQGFATQFTATAIAITSINVLGRGFSTGVSYSEVLGRGFSTAARITFAPHASFNEAFVMNAVSNAVSRYSNYPFMHIAVIGGKYYGVKTDGLYELTGEDDITTPVNGSITTHDTDFETFQSKHVPFMYIDGDDAYEVTPIVDGVLSVSRPAEFGGRKVKFGRGLRGRYWAFKIEGIKRLQGTEYLPIEKLRRVK